jgi:hypothetical protein
METFEVKIINPKAAQLLKGLEELKLISIRDTKKELVSVLKKRKQKNGMVINKNTPADTYPFKPQYLAFSGVNYILREKLNADVAFEDGHYIITNELLNITVWGKTRDEAEEAFAFTFHSLYENFAKEHDKNLTVQARQLKQTLRNLIVK